MSRRMRDYPYTDSLHPDAPWNDATEIYWCCDCGASGAFLTEEEACEAMWQLLDRGDWGPGEGAPTEALGDGWFCPECAEERQG